MNIRQKYILNKEAQVYRYTSQNSLDAKKVYENLYKDIGCTYIIYMYEDLIANKKYIYSSNWEWQNLLIGEKLINNCPIFLAAFKYLEKKRTGCIFLPWVFSPPQNLTERNVCGLRSEFNIANGFGYGAKEDGVRETLAFAGDIQDKDFYKNFMEKNTFFYKTLL